MSDFEHADEFVELPANPEKRAKVLEALKRIGKGAGGLAVAAVGVTLSYVGGEWMINDAVTHLHEAEDYGQELYWATGLVFGTLVSAAGALGSAITGGVVIKDAITG